MSLYAWEHGSIDLPTADAPRIKKALREAHNKHVERVYQTCKAFWGSKGTRSREKYRKAIHDLRVPDEIHADVTDVLHHIDWTTERDGSNLRGATWSDLEKVGLGKKTNRDNSFPVDGEGSIRFDGRTVIWDVPENNHAPERAHDAPIARLFFALLDRVKWTRGSGGVITGNDEYNRDGHEYDSGANYIVRTYGPKGQRVRGW